MITLADVILWGTRVGVIAWDDKRQVGNFEYTKEFAETGFEIAPITMPLRSGTIYSFATLGYDTFLGLPGLLADSMPDAFGKALLDRWLASVGRMFANPVERLCYQGSRSMGALEFVPANDNFLEQNTRIEIDSLINIAREVLNEKTTLNVNLRSDLKEGIADIIRVGTSAGGQRAKAVIAYNEQTGEVRIGQVSAPEGFTQWRNQRRIRRSETFWAN